MCSTADIENKLSNVFKFQVHAIALATLDSQLTYTYNDFKSNVKTQSFKIIMINWA